MSLRASTLRRALVPFLPVLLAGSLCGCSLFASSKSTSTADSAPAGAPRRKTTALTVESKKHTNAGKVFTMMVRSVPVKIAETKSETYEEAARMLSDPRDEAVVLAEPLFPGKTTRVTVEQDDEKRLILYFLFTTPGDFWRVQIAGAPPASVQVLLDENGVERYEVRR